MILEELAEVPAQVVVSAAEKIKTVMWVQIREEEEGKDGEGGDLPHINCGKGFLAGEAKANGVGKARHGINEEKGEVLLYWWSN